MATGEEQAKFISISPAQRFSVMTASRKCGARQWMWVTVAVVVVVACVVGVWLLVSVANNSQNNNNNNNGEKQQDGNNDGNNDDAQPDQPPEQQQPLACVSAPCLNGATCSNGDSVFVCKCTPQFQGLTCAEPLDAVDPCASNKGGCDAELGICVWSAVNNIRSCACPDNYTLNDDDGVTCDAVIVVDKKPTGGVCGSSPCRNGGQCISSSFASRASFTCKCTAGYSGTRCQSKAKPTPTPDDNPSNNVTTTNIVTTGVYLTWYGFDDNDDGSGNYATNVIAWPKIHQVATEDKGTYENPSTFATSENSKYFKKHDIIYLPRLHKYYILEDTCRSCATDEAAGKLHIDLFMGLNTRKQLQPLIDCEEQHTEDAVTVIRNPSRDWPVELTPVFDGTKCSTKLYPETVTPPTPPASGPCSNSNGGCDSAHGICTVVSSTTRKCSCETGFKLQTNGVTCVEDPSSDTPRGCATSPCMNGGTCKNNDAAGTTYTCQCSSQYSGTKCEKPVTPSQNNYTTYTDVYVTWYGFDDNDDGSGNYATNTIAYPGKMHQYATEDAGTYERPSTYATAANSKWFARWGIIYVPYLHKYFILEDSCRSCADDENSGKKHVDLYMGLSDHPQNPALEQCENAMTVSRTTVIVNPPPNLPVESTKIFDGTRCTSKKFSESVTL